MSINKDQAVAELLRLADICATAKVDLHYANKSVTRAEKWRQETGLAEADVEVEVSTRIRDKIQRGMDEARDAYMTHSVIFPGAHAAALVPLSQIEHVLKTAEHCWAKVDELDEPIDQAWCARENARAAAEAAGALADKAYAALYRAESVYNALEEKRSAPAKLRERMEDAARQAYWESPEGRAADEDEDRRHRNSD